VHGWLLARDLSVTGAAALFSMWVAFASGYAAVYEALVIVLAGIVIYAFLKAHREAAGLVAAPADADVADESAPAGLHRPHLRIARSHSMRQADPGSAVAQADGRTADNKEES
jgi:hypothetical protein